MPRHARLRIEGLPLHVIQRGNNRGRCFFGERDCGLYLALLGELAPKHGCDVHAYVLMPNHVHLLLSPRVPLSASVLMKHLGQRYVQYVNRKHARTGSLWEGRFRSCIVDSDGYFLRCQRYVELNPVRAGIVRHPSDYPWSSHAANASGANSEIVIPHPLYLALGIDAGDRFANYCALIQEGIGNRELEEIRSATNGGFVLGSKAFKARLEAIMGRRTSPGANGRPPRSKPRPGFFPAENRGLSPVSGLDQELAAALP
jgi:putative transposase